MKERISLQRLTKMTHFPVWAEDVVKKTLKLLEVFVE